ncbi:unnamed protein product [Phytomonas sp. Hart1]|nr:unnamed protein product [Phytomonas sp. Hart1]|eukprot:CCW70710.1 unnamed protein product [Phytomonas sp. isolate Hart1]
MRIEGPYTLNEVGVSEEGLMRQVKVNMVLLMGLEKRNQRIPDWRDPETSGNISGTEGNEMRGQVVNHLQLSLMLAANLSGGPMINGANTNTFFPKTLATMPTVP